MCLRSLTSVHIKESNKSGQILQENDKNLESALLALCKDKTTLSSLKAKCFEEWIQLIHITTHSEPTPTSI